MKKTLAIVLALAMVLCMVPAAFATRYESISSKSYDISAYEAKEDGSAPHLTGKSATNSLTVEYNYEELDEVETGRYTEDRKMILVNVDGFDSELAGADEVEVTVDGKKLEVNEDADYKQHIGYNENEDWVVFPVEATKNGYSDTYVIEVKATKNKGTENETVITETAKVSVKLVNNAEYKNAKKATISKIETTDSDILDAYIVGSKIYLDFVNGSNQHDEIVELTFKDNNGKLFDVVTWASQPDSKLGKDDAIFGLDAEKKLEDSKVKYNVRNVGEDGLKEVVFELETSNAIYETKEYTVVVRENIKATDPKGIYFADSSKTIKIGEEYTPVVLGVANGKKVDADILPGDNTDRQVIDIDDNTVIGTQEGVAYITAEYTPAGSNNTYEASSMKITVTAGKVEEDDDDDKDGASYVVTASSLNVRNGAGTNYSKIGSLKNGAVVKVDNIANGWAKLENGGYVSAQYLAKVVEDGEAQTMYVTARTLNVRKGAGTSFAKVGTLSRGDKVEVVSVMGSWAKLSNGYYVSMNYLTK